MLVHARAAALLGIEMVLTRLPGKDLAILGDLEALRVRLCSFDAHGKFSSKY